MSTCKRFAVFPLRLFTIFFRQKFTLSLCSVLINECAYMYSYVVVMLILHKTFKLLTAITIIRSNLDRCRTANKDDCTLPTFLFRRERERLEKQNTVKKSITPKPDFVTQRQLCHRQQEAEAKVHILNLQVRKCLRSTCFVVMMAALQSTAEICA